MSGGFFRGTSADQDTRFSNKQAKLLKSQKFAPELDQLVDMTKVKMDVIRPWIATRATELLGFEDEVLINFVYGLLDGKEVDGKQIQIQLTGFMEKNTGKFMKELWGLLISAQNNVSGVPQQLLDAKEEETRKKKVETDRIAQEIQKRRDRDGKEPDRERKSRFDGETYISGFTGASSDQVSKFSKPRLSSIEPEVDIEEEGKHGSRAKNGSPPPKDHSQSPPRKTVPSPARSESKSLSRSRSYSEDRHKSTSRSISSQSPRRSVSPAQHSQSPPARPISPRKRYRSPPRRSISPRRRRQSPRDTRSPLRRRSPYRRRRSSSRSRYRSPPPIRYRSPRRRRSPVRRRSPSPVRRRSPSPVHRRSPSPARRRSPSPLYRRSPSPWHRRSPGKARRRSPSPIRRRSPIRQRSISPKRRRSPSLLRRSPPPRSPKLRRRSPLHSPKNRSANSPNSPRQRKRSRSPYRSQSPSRRTRRSLSRERDSRMNGNEYSRHRDGQTSQRFDAKKSPERDVSERPGSRHKASESLPHKMPISLRSPQRDIMNRPEERNKVPVASPENSSRQSDSPTDMPKINSRINRRSRSFSRSPIGRASYRAPRHDSPVTNLEEANNAREVTRHRVDSSRRRNRDSSKDVGLKKAYANNHSPKSYSPDKRASNQSPVAHGRRVQSEVKKDSGPLPKSNVVLPERRVEHLPYSSEEHEYNPASVIEERGAPRGGNDKERSSKLLKKDDSSLDGRKYTEQIVDGERREKKIGDEFIESHQEMLFMNRSKKETSKKNRQDKDNSDSEETDLYQNQSGEKHRHKKSDKRKRDSDESSGSDSQIEDKKEAKRRRKDEKRLRKEERRRRREERHRRKLERRAGKLKSKYIDTVNPTSDFEKDHSDSADSDGGNTGSRKKFHPNDADDRESDPKKLEIELREKALESLRAKKAISH